MTTKERTKKLACAFKSLKCSSRAVDGEPGLNQSHPQRKQDPMPKDVSPIWNAALAKRNVGTRNAIKSSPTHTIESNSSETLWMPINGSDGEQKACGNPGSIEHGFGPVFDVPEQAPAESPSGKSLVLFPQQQLRKLQKEEKQKPSSFPSAAANMILRTAQTESSSAKLRPEGSKPVVKTSAVVALCPGSSLDMKSIDKIPDENTLAMSNRDVLYNSPSASLTKGSSDVVLLPNSPPYDRMISTTTVLDSAATIATSEGRSLADSITTLDDSTSATDSVVQDDLGRFIKRHTVWMTDATKPRTPPVMDIDPTSPEPEIEKGKQENALANTLLDAQTQQEPTFQDREAFRMVQSRVDPIDAPPPPLPPRPPRLNDFTEEIKIAERGDNSSTEKKRPKASYLNALELAPNDAALTFGFREHVEIHRSATKTTIVTQLTPPIFPGWPSVKSGTETSTGTESSYSTISSFADVAGIQRSNRLTSPIVNNPAVPKPPSFFWRTHPKATGRSDDPQRPHRSTMREVVPNLRLVATGDSASFDKLFFTEPDNQHDLQDGTKGVRVYEPYLLPSIVREMWMDSKPPRPRATLGR